MILAQTDPVPIDDALAADRAATQHARSARTAPTATTSWRGRDGGCWPPTEQTVRRRRRRRAAGGAGALVGGRALPPGRSTTAASSCARPRPPERAAARRGRRHREAAIESLRLTSRSTPRCAAPGSRPGRWTAPRPWRCCGSACTPPPTTLPDFADVCADACQIATATTPEAAGRARHRVLEAIVRRPAGRAGRRRAPGVDPPRRRHARGDDPPGHAAAGDRPVVAGASADLPAAGHAGGPHLVGARSRERARQRRRWQRLRAAVRYKDRRDRLVGSDEEDALAEAAVLDAELAGEIGATVYDVGDLLLAPRPRRRRRALRAHWSSRPARTSTRSPTPGCCAAATSRWPGFTSTLPLATDTLRARRRYAQRNIAHCVPLDLQPLRLPRRARPRHRRPRRHARAPGPV